MSVPVELRRKRGEGGQLSNIAGAFDRVRRLREVRDQPAPAHPMSQTEIAIAIATIKERARRLRPPQNGNPHQWHEDKSELVRDIEVLENAVRKGEPLPERLKG